MPNRRPASSLVQASTGRSSPSTRTVIRPCSDARPCSATPTRRRGSCQPGLQQSAEVHQVAGAPVGLLLRRPGADGVDGAQCVGHHLAADRGGTSTPVDAAREDDTVLMLLGAHLVIMPPRCSGGVHVTAQALAGIRSATDTLTPDTEAACNGTHRPRRARRVLPGRLRRRGGAAAARRRDPGTPPRPSRSRPPARPSYSPRRVTCSRTRTWSATPTPVRRPSPTAASRRARGRRPGPARRPRGRPHRPADHRTADLPGRRRAEDRVAWSSPWATRSAWQAASRPGSSAASAAPSPCAPATPPGSSRTSSRPTRRSTRATPGAPSPTPGAASSASTQRSQASGSVSPSRSTRPRAGSSTR